MPKQQQLVYLSDEQFQTLVAQGSITVNGQTVEYSEDDIYVTPQKDAYIKPATGIPASDLADNAVPVKDVQVNGSSVLQNGIANIDVANLDDIVAVQDTQPTSEDNKIWLPETPPAGVEIPTVAEMNAALAEKVDDVQVNGVSVVQSGIANVPVAGPNTLGAVKVDADYGTEITNQKIRVVKAADDQVKQGTHVARPIAPASQHLSTFYGLAKAAGHDEKESILPVGQYTPEAQSAIQTMLDVPSNADLTQAITNVTQKIQNMYICSASEYNSETGVPTVANPDSKTFYLVPSSEGSPNLYIEWVYLNNAWERFGSATIDLSNYVQKTDYAVDATHPGIVAAPSEAQRFVSGTGVHLINGVLCLTEANASNIKSGVSSSMGITPAVQHNAAFYGLAKAAGDTTQSQSSNAVGSYTPEAQSAIRSMIGAANADDIVAIQDTQPTSEDNKIWLPETLPAGVEIPTVAEMNAALAGKVGDVQVNGQSIVQNGAANVPIANASSPGVAKVVANNGITIVNDALTVYAPGDTELRQGTHNYRPITPSKQHASTFYGLAKAAGDTTQSQSSNAVGTYTPEAKAAIQEMLGVDTGIEIINLTGGDTNG